MNKILISLMVVLGLSVSAQAWDKNTFVQKYMNNATTATQVFTGPGYLLGMSLGDPGASHTYSSDNYLVAYDTAAATLAGAHDSMADANRIVFPILFTSTPTAALDKEKGYVYWFPSPGIFVTNGLYGRKTDTKAPAILYYKR
jgi:hypothetical protein